MNINKNYECEFCNYKCKYKSQFDQHLETNKHKNNGIIVRNVKKENNNNNKCKFCNFKVNHSSNLKIHILANHCTEEERKKIATYYCESCCYATYSKILYENHCKTIKHNNII
jgi:hypothetical protein